MLSRLLASLLICISLSSFSQEGDFPIKNHVPSIPGIDNSTSDILFDQNGLMYVANRSGLLRFDGAKWEFISTPSAVLSLDINRETNQIYLGCHGNYGYLQLTKRGLQYTMMSADSLENSFFSTQIIGDSIFYLSKSEVHVYNTTSQKVNTYKSPDRYDLMSITVIDEQIYLNTKIASYKLKDGKITSSEDWVIDMAPPEKIKKSTKGSYAILDLSGKAFIKTTNGKIIQIEGSENEGNDIGWVNDSLVVLSTNDLGCLFVNGKTGKIETKVDYESGLPDNEIFEIEIDWIQGVWVAHEFGFSRIDPTAPVQCLSNYEGIEGNLLSSYNFKGEVFVGTSSGLFKLKIDSVFSIKISKDKIKSGSKPIKKAKPTEPQKQFEYSRWIYERVPEIISKCNTMVAHDDVMLVGTNKGLFEYNGVSFTKILDRPVKQVIPLKDSHEFFVIGHDLQAERYLRENDAYSALSFGYNDAPVLSIFNDANGLLWIVTPGKLVLSGMTYYGVSALKEVDFPNEYFDKPTMVELEDKLYFVTKEGFYLYNYRNNTLPMDSSMLEKYGTPIEHKSDARNGFWMFDGKIWKHIDPKGMISTYPYLSLFPELRYINKTASGEVYFIDEKNQFYKYEPDADRANIYQSTIFYKHVLAGSQYNTFKDKFDLNYDENNFSAEISQPDYLGLLNVEFQHKVEGMSKEWSSWSPNNRIDLDHLPDGKYILHVRSRDVFGRIQVMEPITMVIKPPYWQTAWFYMLEVVFFASLVIISARLNQKKAQNRILTEGLTILTIILIIESMQSLAASFFVFASSPILDFIINLTIALLIFPAEQFLKKLIKDGNITVKIKRRKEEIT